MANLSRSLILAIFRLLFVRFPAVFAEESDTLIADVPTHQLDYPLTTPVNHCAMCSTSVKREEAGAASNAACQYWWQTMMYEGGFGADGVGYMYGLDDGRNIYLKFTAFWQELGCEFTYNDMYFHYDKCYYGFMKPVDWCNTAGVNGKQGGWWWDECGTFVFNPHPEGCENDKFVSPDTVKHFAISDNTVYHHPTPEEHAANVAAARDFEGSMAKAGR